MVIFLILSLLHLLVDMNKFLFSHNVTITVNNYRCKVYHREPSGTRFRRSSLDISVRALGDIYMESSMIWLALRQEHDSSFLATKIS